MKWWTFLNRFCDKLFTLSVLSINLSLSQHKRIYNHPSSVDTCTRVTSTRAVSTIWTRPPAPPPTPGRCWGWAGCCPTSPSPPRTPSSSASTSKHCWLGHKWQLPARFQIFVRQKYFSDSRKNNMEMFGRQDGPPKSYKTRRLLVIQNSDTSNVYFLKVYLN